MNRENKRKMYEKGYYKTHACEESFVCKICGRQVIPEGAGSKHRNHCPNCLTSLHVDIEPETVHQTAAVIWNRWRSGSEKTENGQLYTAAASVGR